MKKLDDANRSSNGTGRPKIYHYTECGLDNVFLLDGFVVEQFEGESYVSVESIDGLWKAIGLDLATRRDTLAPRELRFLRGLMDMTQRELAALLRVEDQTVARWEKARIDLPGAADIAVRALFLGSPTVQPEGGQRLAQWLRTVRSFADADKANRQPVVLARTNEGWAPRPMSLAA